MFILNVQGCKRFYFLKNTSFVKYPDNNKVVIILSEHNKYFVYNPLNQRKYRFNGFIKPNDKVHICYPKAFYKDTQYYSFVNQMEFMNYRAAHLDTGSSRLGERRHLSEITGDAIRSLI